MVRAETPAKNGFVRQARKIYNPLGFGKGYNALLWLILDGAFLGFVLARMEFFSFNGMFCNAATADSDINHAGPGDCYWYRSLQRNNVGIQLHLATILPAAFLAAFQFVPAIRHKVILYHRMAGYVVILLLLISHVGALMIANHSYGGDASVQSAVGALAILSTVSIIIAYWNVKCLQIDQHRAWMLRTWVYLGSSVTLRIIQVIAVRIQAGWGEAAQHVTLDCNEIIDIYQGATESVYQAYPGCMPNSTMFTAQGYVPVTADFTSDDPAQKGAALYSYFGMASWVALLVHVVGIEIYLRLTPKESERLRQVSYERQLERGFNHPGSTGLVGDRLGDGVPWVPRSLKAQPHTLVECKAVAEDKRDVNTKVMLKGPESPSLMSLDGEA